MSISALSMTYSEIAPVDFLFHHGNDGEEDADGIEYERSDDDDDDEEMTTIHPDDQMEIENDDDDDDDEMKKVKTHGISSTKTSHNKEKRTPLVFIAYEDATVQVISLETDQEVGCYFQLSQGPSVLQLKQRTNNRHPENRRGEVTVKAMMVTHVGPSNNLAMHDYVMIVGSDDDSQ